MPHITIEYSANVGDHHDIDELVAAVHEAALEHGLPAMDALRTRAAGRDHYRVADGRVTHGFVAMAVRIGPGRTDEEKASFAEALLDAAEATIDDGPSPLDIAWSIEVTEIDPRYRINRNHVRAALAADEPGGP